MAGEDVKILGGLWSPFVMRPRIALNLKGVGYEFVDENVNVSKSELLLKSNPVYKKIPVLLHGDKAISESMIIVEYVDAAWGCAENGSSILPKDPYAHAMARFWAYFVDDKWCPSLFGILKPETDEAQASCIDQLFANSQLLEEAFNKSSKGKGFFGGDTIGYVDIALGSYIGWLKAAEQLSSTKLINEEETPLLAGWVERFRADEAVKGVMPETEKLVEYSKVLQAKWKAATAE